jgi:glycosyltransferase involved in cell wall biosynthesis
MYRQFRCYVSLGTKPAPLVLTLIEAICTGTPVIAYDNGCGITGEGLGVLVVDNVVDLHNAISMLVTNTIAVADELSGTMKETAKREFAIEVVAGKWESFMEEMKI